MHVAAGSRIGARGLAWDVLDVAPVGAQNRLHLRCVSGDLHGLEWDLLHPAEPIEPIDTPLRPDAPAPLSDWRLRQTAHLLDQLPGSDAVLSAEPGRIAIEPYQLVPLMRALEQSRVRLLLADAVGLGKTIQAGLIATEWIARRRAHRILVVAPAGPLLIQWQHELRQRFGLRFTAIADAASLQRERRRLELGGNPFDSIALCLVSLDFAKQDHVLDELERAAWDLAIIDEAHHCIATAPGAERDDTQRRRLAEVIACRADGLLLLTATPHDGYDAHFASLIELLDPSLVDGKGGLAGLAYRRHVVRRLKSHIRNPVTGAPLFRPRRVIPVRIAGIAAQAQAFHAALAALVAPRLRRAKSAGDYADALAFIGLLKRSISTIDACVATLHVVAERYRALRADAAEEAGLRRERRRALRDYRRRRLRFGVLDAAAEAAAATLEAEDMAADLCRFGVAAPQEPPNSVLVALEALIRLGRTAAGCDPKLAALCDEVRQIRRASPGANVLVYTEYADSQAAAVQALRAAGGIAGETLAISGLDPEAERVRIAERCAERDSIVLVSTDSMAEGLNLQQRCCHLIHLDLPYNPNRLEQRNGRIDRYGQRRDPQIRYLYLAGTFEERLLLRLIAKYESARACLDVMPDTLGVTADAADWDTGLVAGFAADQAGLFPDDAPAIRTLDVAADADNAAALRDLLHEIDRAFAGYERDAVRHGWLAEQGLNADLRQVAAAAAARRRGDARLGHVDLPGFVAAAIAQETGVATTPEHLALPGDWARGLNDLPGFDPATATLRITRDRNRLCNAQGEPLAYLGRAHPLVRRAIGRLCRGDDAADPHDVRVSAACGETAEPAALLTFVGEIAGPHGVAWQRVVAVRLPRHGPPSEIAAPDDWLRLAAPGRAVPMQDVWRRCFAAWLPRRREQAEACATAALQRLAAAFAATRQRTAQREQDELQRWLRRRTDDICGTYRPPTGDLFGAVPDLPGWQLLAAPLERLAAYAADGDNPPPRRREANSIVAVYQRRHAQAADMAALMPPTLRWLGLLLLAPPA